MKAESKLNYLCHGLTGLIAGLLVCIAYILIVRAQPTTRDYDGYVLVWGSRIGEVTRWAILFPIAFCLIEILGARFSSVRRVYSHLTIKILAVAVLALSGLAVYLLGSTIVNVKFFPEQRDMIKMQ